MACYILPTSEIVREFEHFESLFSFYEDGVRGVVRDIILLNSGCSQSQYFITGVNRKIEIAEDILDSIVRKYNNSPESLLFYYSENTDKSFYVELAAELIILSVNEMLDVLFKFKKRNITKKDYKWIGNDILVIAW